MPSFFKIKKKSIIFWSSEGDTLNAPHLFLKTAITFPNPYGIRNRHSFLTQTNPRRLGKGQSWLNQHHQNSDSEISAKKHDIT